MSESETIAAGGRSGRGASSDESESGAPGPRAPGSPQTGAAPLVLIAEDEEPIAEALELVARDAGYRAVLATDGRQALELAQTNPPALVITDLMMPRLDGAALIRALRLRAAQDGHHAPPIILVTAAGPRIAQAAGADAVLRKPFNVAELDRLLRRFLGGGRGE